MSFVPYDYLALKRHFFWRQNTAPTIQKSAEGWAFRRMPAYRKKGVPDIILIKDGRFIGIEVKRDTGRLSEHQIEFARGTEAAGGTYLVARSIEDVQRAGL